jgi:hypothetical protein
MLDTSLDSAATSDVTQSSTSFPTIAHFQFAVKPRAKGSDSTAGVLSFSGVRSRVAYLLENEESNKPSMRCRPP